MRKTLIAAAIAGAFVLPSAAMAQAAAAPASPHSFSPNVGVVTDYLFRGVSQTHGKAALQGGLDYSHSSGLYAGVWASTITWVKDAYGSGTTEIDYYGGYKNSFAGGDWTYDVGAIAYTYPGKGNAIPGTNVNPNTNEIYGAIGYKWVTMKYSRVVSSGFIGWLGNNGNTDTKGSDYLELNAAYDLGNGWGISGHVGHQKVKNVLAVAATASPSYNDWNLGVTKDAGYGVFGLTYSTTDANGSCGNPLPGVNASAYCWGTNRNAQNFKDVAKSTVVLSFKKTF
ncbi:MAG: hypothetical protein IPH39_09075 [Sulfuritalea sp.]|jgi:uncharacterized protein (TIGR02001 family)|nr:hypothetical protein [Sulfuritalea sp.]MBK9351111.1 hypothetical protein [Sulfuritalea sp.]